MFIIDRLLLFDLILKNATHLKTFHEKRPHYYRIHSHHSINMDSAIVIVLYNVKYIVILCTISCTNRIHTRSSIARANARTVATKSVPATFIGVLMTPSDSVGLQRNAIAVVVDVKLSYVSFVRLSSSNIAQRSQCLCICAFGTFERFLYCTFIAGCALCD